MKTEAELLPEIVHAVDAVFAEEDDCEKNLVRTIEQARRAGRDATEILEHYEAVRVRNAGAWCSEMRRLLRLVIHRRQKAGETTARLEEILTQMNRIPIQP